MAGFGALLGISQRTIQAVYDPKASRSQSRNRIPIEPKTLGDWLHVKRIEADLSQEELAKSLGIGGRKVQAWERDKYVPTKMEWERLMEILPLRSGIPAPFQALESCAGYFTCP